MSCSDTRELLSAHLDGALNDDEEKTLNDHLARCDACRERLEELRGVVDVVRGIPDPSPPEAFATDVMASLPRNRLHRRKRAAKLFWLAPVAAAACLLLLVKSFQEQASEGPRPTKSAAARQLQDEAGGYAQPRPETEEGKPAAVREDPEEQLAKGIAREYEELDDAATGGDESTLGRSRVPAKPVEAPPAVMPPAPEGAPDDSYARLSRKYAVRGADPDTAAGVILAELGHRRDREFLKRSRDKRSAERVVQDSKGEVSGMILSLTADELTFVTALLCEKPGVKVDRENGRAGKKKNISRAEEKLEVAGRYRVELRFR